VPVVGLGVGGDTVAAHPVPDLDAAVDRGGDVQLAIVGPVDTCHHIPVLMLGNGSGETLCCGDII
jgi:hypothetical protein